MPRLPSGRQVALSADYVLALARQGNWTLTFAFMLGVNPVEDLFPVVNVIYFRSVEGDSGPGEPYPSGFMLSDVGTEKSGWPEEDVAFFRQWLASDAAQQWLSSVYEELSELARTVRPPLPKSLHGILDDDD